MIERVQCLPGCELWVPGRSWGMDPCQILIDRHHPRVEGLVATTLRLMDLWQTSRQWALPHGYGCGPARSFDPSPSLLDLGHRLIDALLPDLMASLYLHCTWLYHDQKINLSYELLLMNLWQAVSNEPQTYPARPAGHSRYSVMDEHAATPSWLVPARPERRTLCLAYN